MDRRHTSARKIRPDLWKPEGKMSATFSEKREGSTNKIQLKGGGTGQFTGFVK